MENDVIDMRKVDKKINKVIRTAAKWAISDSDFGFDIVTFAVPALFAAFGVLLIVTWPTAMGMIL